MRRRLTLFPFLLLAACGNDLKPYSLIRALSIIAVRAQPAEVAGGETVRLEAAVADPAGMGRPVRLDWTYCALPVPIDDFVDKRCILEDSAPFLVPLGQGPVIDVTVPQIPRGPCAFAGGSAAALPPLCPQGLGTPDFTWGFYINVRLTTQAGNQKFVTIYPLRYAWPPGIPYLSERNRNPALGDLYAAAAGSDGRVLGLGPIRDGAEIPADSRIALHPVLIPGSAETYRIPNPEALAAKPMPTALDQIFAPTREKLRITWFATAGSFAADTTGENINDTVLTLPKETPAGPLDVWAVVRDERQGVDWLRRTFKVVK